MTLWTVIWNVRTYDRQINFIQWLNGKIWFRTMTGSFWQCNLMQIWFDIRNGMFEFAFNICDIMHRRDLCLSITSHCQRLWTIPIFSHQKIRRKIMRSYCMVWRACWNASVRMSHLPVVFRTIVISKVFVDKYSKRNYVEVFIQFLFLLRILSWNSQSIHQCKWISSTKIIRNIYFYITTKWSHFTIKH